MYKKIVIIIFLSSFYMGNTCCCQSLVGIQGGYLNENIILKKSYTDTLKYNKSYNTYAFSIFYKSRRERKINIGLNMTYYKKHYDFYYFNLVSHKSGWGNLYQGDVHINTHFLYTSPFAELSFGNNWVVNIDFGPSLGFMLTSNKSGYSSIKSSSGSSTSIESGSAAGEVSRYDIRVFGTVGIESPLIKEKLKIVLESSWSRSIENNSVNLNPPKIADFTTWSFMITVGVAYKFNHFNINAPPKNEENK